MRIVQVVPRFLPATGGVEYHVYNISRELLRRGHDVSVVTTKASDSCESLVDEENIDGIKVYRHSLLFPKLFQELWFAPSIIKKVCQMQGDVIHAHGYRCLSSFSATVSSMMNGSPMVLTPHGIYPPQSFLNEFLKLGYDHLFGVMLLKRARKIVALTEHNEALLRAIGAEKKKIVMIPNGVDTERFRKHRRVMEVRKKYGLFASPIILYVGRIDWNKQLEKVVMALPLIIREFIDAKFVIVGPDYNAYSKKLLRLAKIKGVEDSLVLTGRVEEVELPMLYSCGDVFIQPAVYEGFGLSILEAMATEVPVVVSSSSGGPADFLTDKENAILLSSVTPRGISEAIKKLLNSSDLKEKISRNALDLVLSRFSWKSVADSLELVYYEVTEKRG